MSVHLSSFLRKTPSASLRAFLGDASASAFVDVDWGAPRQSLVETLNETIVALDDKARDRVFSDVDRIGQFMNEHGRRVLRWVLPADPEVLDQFDALEDVTACAVFVLMRKDDAFDKALSIIYAERLLNGRNWTGLDFVPDVEPKVRRDPSIADFEERLRKIFTVDGPSPRLVVDRFTRSEPDPAESATLFREQFTIYVEAAPEAELAFTDEKSVVPRPVRPVRQGALLFDAQERTLDVVAKGAGKAQRRNIADAFIETILVPGATLADRSRRTLALDLLKQRPTFEVRPEDRVHSIEVARLDLAARDLEAIATFEVRGRGERRSGPDLYERAERAFGHHGLLASGGWRVIAAKLRIVFEPEKPKARRKTVTFELKAPDRTNLRDQVELHRRIAITLLTRWGLYAAQG